MTVFPDRAARLRTRRDFLRARNGRKAVRNGVIIQAIARDEATGPARAGFTATRKIGNAVERNRAKRRLRSAARQLLPVHGLPGTDYVFIARGLTASRPWTALLEDVKSALLSLGPSGHPRTHSPDDTAS